MILKLNVNNITLSKKLSLINTTAPLREKATGGLYMELCSSNISCENIWVNLIEKVKATRNNLIIFEGVSHTHVLTKVNLGTCMANFFT